MEEIAARAGVGVGTVYRRFASKDALIDELLRLALDELIAAADQALARTDGHGLEDLLRAFGQSFADHARYANLLLERQPDPAVTAAPMCKAIGTLTARAVAEHQHARSRRKSPPPMSRSLASALRQPGAGRAGPGWPGGLTPPAGSGSSTCTWRALRADPG